jgi:serine/threonine-protein kinase HipA
MAIQALSVHLYGKPIGTLEQSATGKMSFFYTDASTLSEPISVGMPIQHEIYTETRCEAFFGGLLPEGEAAKRAIGKQYGISHHNSFALLKAIGSDCAGAISFHPLDEPMNAAQAVLLEGKIIDDETLYQHIIDLPKKPLFLGVEGLRLSLAGVHDKAAVCLIDKKIALPMHHCPTTHILKPSTSLFEGLAENEYFCLKMAARIGLPVPHIEIRQIKNVRFLLVERYDRQIKNNQVTRIHQEDFCQALGIVSSRKYQNEGGPGFKDCFALLQYTLQPAINRNLLASLMVFNFLIGNMDAHGKNFSLLHQGSINITLAPCYDLLCTLVYSHLSKKMAMKIGSQYHTENILPRHWEVLCQTIGYSFPALRVLLKKQGEAILKALEIEKNELLQWDKKMAIIDKIENIVKQRIHQTLERLI